MAKTLVQFRREAAKRQSFLCYYCRSAMWEHGCRAYAREHGITRARAWDFFCTAEHLVPRAHGGPTSAKNIAAACKACNQRRGQMKPAPSPAEFRRMRQHLSGGRRPEKVGAIVVVENRSVSGIQPARISGYSQDTAAGAI